MSRQRVAEGVYRYITRQGTNYVVSASHKGAREWRATEPGATLREAKALRDGLRRELASPRPAGPAPWTVRIAAAAWIKDGKVAGLAASTLDVRRLAVEALCRHVDGSRPLRDLTVSDYEQARDRLLETLAPGTLRSYITNWRTLETWARKRGQVDTPQAALVSLPKAPPIAKALTLEALQAFLAACERETDGESASYAHLLAVLALMQLRMSELRGMQWRDIDLTAGFYHLTRAMGPTGKVKTARDGKLHPRTVPIPSPCLTYFRAQRAWQRARGLPDVDPEGWVWSDDRVQPLPYSI